MATRLARHAPLLVAVATCVVLMVGLWPELSIGRSDLNDHCFHGPIIARMAEALQRGENPLDCWMNEWTLGHPVPRTYQPLPHLAAALLWLGSWKSVELGTLFIVLRTVLLALWPLTIYASARLLRLEPWRAACCALVAPLVATAGWYGLELGSHAWRGSGLYTQLWGMHALAFAFALGLRAIRWGRSCTLAALAIAATFGSHFVYGQIAALSVAFVAALPAADASLRARCLRLAAVGGLTVVFSAWLLGPLLADAPILNHSRWEAAWKWDSVGLARVGELLWKGELLDQGRLPVLTVLALGCVAAAFWRRDETMRAVVALTGIWLLLFAGRPAWGPFLQLLALGNDVPLHRLIGGAHLFLILAAGLGLAALAALVSARFGTRARGAVAAAVVALALWPAWRERAAWLRTNAEWGRTNLAAWERERADVERVVEACREGGGRVYPGLAAGWGRQFKVGDVPMYAFLSGGRVPTLAFLYHAMPLPADVMVLFDERVQEQYRVFGITRVVAPTDRALPEFLVPLAEAGRFRVHSAPGEGFFDVVTLGAVASIDKRSFYDVASAWLASDWPAKRQHVALEIGALHSPRDRGLESLPRVIPGGPLPAVGETRPGRVETELRDGETYTARVHADVECHVLLKTTWHPNWRIEVDGNVVRSRHVTPGFLAVPVSPGPHEIRARYAPGRSKLVLIALIPLVAAASALGERRGLLRRIEEGAAARRQEAAAPAWRPTLVTAAVLAALVLPFVAQLLHGDLVKGHDQSSYLARLVEMHENVREGIVLARWAPDLGSGHGQPLFVFAPPLLYWLAEAWHLAGLDIAWSMNLAAACVVVASALAMARLGTLLFGVQAGRLAAAAYVLAPYFCLDLFVRQALAELAAFPLYPLVLDGLLRHDRTGQRRWLVQAALAYGAVTCAHPPSALLFAPIPPAFALVLALRRPEARSLVLHAAALGCGLLVGAFAWLPGLLEKHHVKIERLLSHPSLRYEIHFVHPGQLLTSAWGHGISVEGPADGMSFELGRVHLVLALLVLVVAWRRRDLGLPRSVLGFLAGVVVVAALGSSTFARPLWDRVELLQVVQFPWRLHAAATVALALLVGAAAQAFAAFGRRRDALLGIAVTALVLVNLPHAQSAGRDRVDLDRWTPEAIARQGLGVTTADEYEPQVVQRSQPWSAERIAVGPGLTILDQRFGAQSAHASIRADIPGEVWFRAYGYPGWIVTIDGRRGRPRLAVPSGFLIADVSAGTHEVAFVLERTGTQRAGLALSVAGFLGLAALAFAGRRRGPAPQHPSPQGPSMRPSD